MPLSSGRKRSIEESRACLPPSPTMESAEEIKESRLSPDRVSESGSESSPPPEFSELTRTQTPPEVSERKGRKSRSRSPSPLGISQMPQTASPVRSLPPVISVTPDTPDTFTSHGTSSDVQPQRAVISYTSYTEQSDRESQRESFQSPISSSFPLNGTHLIAFPVSQVPAQFYSLTSHPVEPGIAESTRQLIRVLRAAGLKTLRQFVGYVSSMVGEDSREKIREVELTLCALLLLVTGLLIFLFTNPRTITHHHHWDYFNPPK